MAVGAVMMVGIVVVVAVVVVGATVVAIIVVIGPEEVSYLYARPLLFDCMPCTCILLVCLALIRHTQRTYTCIFFVCPSILRDTRHEVQHKEVP